MIFFVRSIACNTNFIKLIGLFALIWGVLVNISTAQEPAVLLERLQKFDISCRVFDERFAKKECGLEHRAAYTNLIGQADKKGVLALVESERKISRGRLERLRKPAASASVVGEAKSNRYGELTDKAQRGDPEAFEALRAAGPEAIPALVGLKDNPAVLPSPEIQKLLGELESQADIMVEQGGQGLSAGTLALLISRGKNYDDILKRAVIALEGTRRAYPYWLPFVYMYLIGFIPFLFGIVASVIYYGRVQGRIMALIAGCYIFYFCLHGFFQFFAPWIN